LCEGGGGIDLPDKKKEGCPKDIARLFRRMGSLNRSALFIKAFTAPPEAFVSYLFPSKVKPNGNR